MNVAFEQKATNQSNVKKRTNKNQKHKKEVNIETLPSHFNVPDRITGRNGITELKALNPERKWNFIEVLYMYATRFKLGFLKDLHLAVLPALNG